jgi:hypothetical protein
METPASQALAFKAVGLETATGVEPGYQEY